MVRHFAVDMLVSFISTARGTHVVRTDVQPTNSQQTDTTQTQHRQRDRRSYPHVTQTLTLVPVCDSLNNLEQPANCSLQGD